MRKLLITLDDDLDKVLAKYPNQNETVREALRLYNGDIRTDTVNGLRQSFLTIAQSLKNQDQKIDELSDLLERIIKLIEYANSR